MTVSNPRWLIDGTPATSFVFGRRAEMTVDVSNFSGELVFKLNNSATATQLKSYSVGLSAGSQPVTVSAPATLNYQWPVLEQLPTSWSLYEECYKAGSTRPYPTNAWFLANPISDDLLFPPLSFTVTEPDQAPVPSGVINRARPQFVPGNKVDLLVNGDQILAKLLADLSAAQHNVHINWFFFAPDDIGVQIFAALEACARRGVEVRILFDMVMTAMPEPVGQGVLPWIQGSAVGDLRSAGAHVASSAMFVPPLDNFLTITDAEYRDRADIQKEYAKTIIAKNGIPLAAATLNNLNDSTVLGGLPGFIVKEINSLGDLGSAGLGSPVLLAGCRDHSKLIIVDGSIAYCGGPNCHRYYLFEDAIDPATDATTEAQNAATENWEKWHDCFARYQGPAVSDAQHYFIERWAVSTGEYLSRTSSNYFPALTSVGSASVKVINNLPGLERDIAAEYLRMFRNSQQKILVENPYVTDDLLATYLAHAAQIRNIPVELIVPSKHLDFKLARDLMQARWDSLRAAGIDLYSYDNHMSHVKAATADGSTSIVASYNFAKSSAASLFETGIVVDDAGFASDVETMLFGVDKPVSTLVTTSMAPDWPNVGQEMVIIDRMV